MDRVLIIIDNVQFNAHLEYTFRKVGYTTETLQSEYNLFERVLSFNPDVIICRGSTQRLSALKIGKKLKDNVKFMGKVILIFPEGAKPDAAAKSQIKVDLVLEEPASAIKIVAAAMTLEKTDRTAMKEKLYKLVSDDKQYRNEEQSYLKTYGVTIDDEIIHVRSSSEKNTLMTEESTTQNQTTLSEIGDEILVREARSSIQIDEYNKMIENIDIDLKKGLKKRDTKKILKDQRQNWGIPVGQTETNQDLLRQQFVTELFKKK